MAWGGNRNFRGKSGAKKNEATAGAFKTKTPGLYVARFDGKWFKAAYAVFKQAAQQDEPGVVVFVRKNEQRGDNGPILKLSVAVNKPLGRGRIQNDPDDDPDMESGDESQEDVNYEDPE